MKLRDLAACAALAGTAASTLVLTGCAPLVAGAVIGGGALVAADRRTTGAQVDDESIEIKVQNAARARYGDRIHLNATSYNGVVLLTGEVPDESARNDLANLARTTERVRGVQNEVVVGAPSSMGDRSNDTLLTSKVKTRFVEANEFGANYVKVVTERGVVYLMGLVSRQEGDAAARLASQTSGVARVVRVFEYTS